MLLTDIAHHLHCPDSTCQVTAVSMGGDMRQVSKQVCPQNLPWQNLDVHAAN